MYNAFSNYNSPYIMPVSGSYPYSPPRQEIIKVNGEEGARTFAAKMSPNSSALLLDENNSIVWAVQTDGAGYPKIVPYKIELYRPENTNTGDLERRIKRLEELYESDIINAQQLTKSKHTQPDTTNKELAERKH